MAEPMTETPEYEESNRRALELSDLLLAYEKWIWAIQPNINSAVDKGVVAAARIIIESMIDEDWPRWKEVQHERFEADCAKALRTADG